jgi:hypothetical protein
MRHVHGHILRPVLCGVKGDDAGRVDILAGEQVLDYGFQIGLAVVHLAPHAVGFVIIGYQIYGVIIFRWYNRWRPISLSAYPKLQRNRTGIQVQILRFVPKDCSE